MGLLVDEHPHLIDEIVQVSNNKPINLLTSGSGIKVLWQCPQQPHTYETTVRHRVYGIGCSYCSGNKILVGFNDLVTTHPELKKAWATENTLQISEVSAGSRKLALWVCGNNHKREIMINQYVRYRYKCKECTPQNNLLLSELKKEVHPIIIKDILNPDTTVTKSEKILWLGTCGHEWTASLKSRELGRGCPYCAGFAVLPGFNDIATTNPSIAAMLDDEQFTATMLSAGSSRQVKWRCPLDHTFSQEVAYVIGSEAESLGCPYCANQIVVAGFNDIATTHPHLLKEWDSSEISPQTVTFGSNTLVQWKCKESHTWIAKVNSRTGKIPRGCPKCQSSAGERELALWILSLIPEAICHSRSIIRPLELDIFLPNHNIAFEFNGIYWHSELAGKDKQYHQKKTQLCQEQGIELFHIWEDDWYNKKDIVKAKILHKLGLDSKEESVNNMKLSVISAEEAQSFIEENSIQSYLPGTANYGIKNNEEKLIAVLAGFFSDDVLVIQHYEDLLNSSSNFSQIITYAVQQNPTIKGIEATINSWETKEFYTENGFEKVHETDPDYMYIAGNERKNKTYFPIESSTQLNRIWDEGKTTYIKLVSDTL